MSIAAYQKKTIISMGHSLSTVDNQIGLMASHMAIKLTMPLLTTLVIPHYKPVCWRDIYKLYGYVSC